MVKKSVKPKRSSKLQKTAATTSIISIVSGLFFLTPNITGNVVGNLDYASLNFIGSGLLIIGGLLGLYYIKKSQKKTNISKKRK